MKRAYAKRADSHKRDRQKRRTQAQAAAREIQLPLDREELLTLMQDSLETLAVELGLLVASGLLEDEVTRLCGRRYERQPERVHTRYGHQQGVATLAGQKVCDHTSPSTTDRRRWRGTPGDVFAAPVARGHAKGRAPPHGAWCKHT